MTERVLGFSVPVHPEGLPSVSYPAGTSESEIPEEHLALITNPKAWAASPATPFNEDGTIGGFVENESAPTTLDECNEAELRVIAEREGIELGRLRNPDKIREVLREFGIGDDGEMV